MHSGSGERRGTLAHYIAHCIENRSAFVGFIFWGSLWKVIYKGEIFKTYLT